MNYTQKINSIIKKLKLDLTGLTVLTELASGPYLLNVLLIALAGGKVICIGKDSDYGLFEGIVNQLKATCNENQMQNILIFKERCPAGSLSEVDIITNSGLLRPIESDIITKVKKTAIISLMWETWEFRDSDLDLKCCQKHSIPVIGTNENYRAIKMFGYNIFIVLKLLFELDLEIYNNKLAIIGSGPSIEPVIQKLIALDCDFVWVSDKPSDNVYCTYDNIDKVLDLDYLDGIIIFDHSNPSQLIGVNSKLTFHLIKEKFPNIKIGHISGNIDIQNLLDSSIEFLPKKIMPFGYMSYQAYHLGGQPVLELFAAGLKVGEIAARARLNGASIEEAIKSTVDYGIGQDFDGGFMNYDPKNRE